MSDYPIIYKCSRDALVPLGRYRQRFTEEFEDGQLYQMTAVAGHSERSRGHYFATIADKWLTLPPHIAMQFPSPAALRKHALIMTGFRKERKFACESPDAAKRLAVFLRQGTYDDYTLISIFENVVVEWRPVSQAKAAMGAKTFQESKQAVLDWIDGLFVSQAEAA